MATRVFNKAIIALSAVLTLGLSGCSGCSPHTWSSDSSETSVDPSSVTNVYEIKWVNYGNKLIYKDTVLEGETPVYHGEIPTREGTEKDNYVFTGWSPEIVPAYKNATYKAKYKTEPKTFTVAFVAGNCTCQYSQDLIADVPYGTRVAIDGNAIIINGTRVTVEATPTEGESILHNYTFDRWSVYDGYEITGNTTISAQFYTTDKLYKLTVKGVGGGMVRDSNSSDYEYFYANAKSYTMRVDGGTEGEITSNEIYLSTLINGFEHSYFFGTWSPYEDFYTYDFDGWYYNDEQLRYGMELTGDVLLEARFHKVPLDYSFLFDFEINTLTQDATIIGVKENYIGTSVVDLSIPRSFEGYPVSGIKNGALSSIFVNGTLAIPNTLAFIEEVESLESSMRVSYSVLQKIVVEEGSTNFRLIDGVLYSYDLTQAIVGTTDMVNYLVNGHYNMPDTVTHIWKSAFQFIQMTSVHISTNVTVIPYCAFANALMASITLHEGITRIEESAFVYSAFESVVLPDSVTYVGQLAFGVNDNLKHVHFGSSFQFLAYDVFYSSKNIESFTVSDDNEFFADYQGALYDKPLEILMKYPSGASNDDPVSKFTSTFKEIAYDAFNQCRFETIHLPEGVEKLQNMCFDYCYNLKNVYLPSTLNYLGGNCFDGCRTVTYMEYNGTIAQFNAIEKDSWNPWNKDLTNLTELVCTDGTIPLAA